MVSLEVIRNKNKTQEASSREKKAQESITAGNKRRKKMNESAVEKGMDKENKLCTDPMITRQKELRKLAEEAGIDTNVYSDGPQYESICLSDLRDLPLIGVNMKRFVHRHYLSGIGELAEDNVEWQRPLSKGILLSLIEAQKTQRFVRFEVWELEKDPILVGFTKWKSRWENGWPEHNCFQFNQVTYKICEWE